MRPSRLLSAAVICFLAVGSGQAATWYIDDTGNDTTGNGSSGTPYKTLDKAWTVGASGDTVILKDGLYNYAGMEFDSGILEGTSWSSSTTIRAENVFGATVTLAGALAMTTNQNWYLLVNGIVFQDYSTSKAVQGHQWKFTNCGFRGGPASGNETNLTVGTNNFTPGASYGLLQDVYFIGNSTSSGRYQLLLYETQRIVVRRGVSWMGDGWDDGGSLNPSADMVVYNSSHTVIQNFIVMDSTNVPDTYQAQFYRVQNSGQSFLGDRNEWYGVMAVNNAKFGIYYDGSQTVSTDTWRNVVVVDSVEGGATFNYSGNVTMTMDGFTVMRASNTGPGTNMYGLQAGNAGTQTVMNGIVANWEDDSISGIGGSTYINCYNNGGTCDGGTGQTTYNPRTNGLTYYPRIESGSNLKTAGSGGGQIGAQIQYKMGTDDTLYGDSGYFLLTANSLWPWPNEAAIRADLCRAYSHGLCLGSKTITEYVHGGSTPYAADTSSPSVPGNLSLNVISDARIDASWSASSDNVAVSGYEIDVSGDSGFSSFVSGFNDLAVGNVTSYSITGLTATTPYWVRVRAKDGAGNTSANSTSVNATTLPDPPGMTASNLILMGVTFK